MTFERLETETVWEGRIAVVRRERWREEDGEEVEREVVGHPGAVGVVAWDDERVWLVRQPREAVGVEDLLEVPAGKLDEPGETPLECARRELAEEIGKQAEHWELLHRCYTSPGFTDEEVHVFLATGVTDVAERPPADDADRIEAARWPLSELDDLIDEVHDAKTLIGLLALRARRG
jgi:8-oxo-dGTP pyrophosphatase MutT (NUDIX family)